jgi:2-dehydro-3-deoxyphosphogalactonate aldolase
VELAVRHSGTRALIGGGTVLRIDQVDRLAERGARLVVAPDTRPPLIAHAAARGLHPIPGFATATEAFAALDAGAQALKLFPATTYGPGHIKSLRAVLPPVPVFAVGGITPANLADYLLAGCDGAGLGGELYRPGQDAARTAQLVLRSDRGYEIEASLDFRHSGKPVWDIEADTVEGPLTLSAGSNVLHLDGVCVSGTTDSEYDGEYASLYRRFAELIAGGESDVDVRPFRLVADAFLIGTRRVDEPLFNPS